MSGRAAPPHPGIYGVPPPGIVRGERKKKHEGKKRGETGALYFSPTPHHRSERLEGWNRLSGIEWKVVWSDLKK